MSAAQYLIWSNQHQMWWRAARAGYTPYIEEAGRYTHDDASQIVSAATLDGALDQAAVNPVTGQEYRRATEHMVAAPESADAAYQRGRAEGKAELAQELMDVRRTYDAVQAAGEAVQP
jgi:hypothetical protein